MAELETLGKVYPFSIPPFFALILRAFSVIEGIALTVDPDYSIVQVCGRNAVIVCPLRSISPCLNVTVIAAAAAAAMPPAPVSALECQGALSLLA
jgi:predicted unusual protein kinase regulating ubiquinone biosynthesis (AarF/ABC1/UbiB family)